MRHLLKSVCFIALLVACGGHVSGDSALPLLSGFDQERVDAAFPPTDRETLGELAKLAYRVRAIDATRLQALQANASDQPPVVGDVFELSGELDGKVAMNVPEKLVEFMEFPRLYVLTIRSAEGPLQIVSPTIPDGISKGDQITVLGIVLDVSDADQTSSEVADANGEETKTRPIALITNTIGWFPRQHASAGQQLLSKNGFDIGLLGTVAARSRKPLLPADADAFYGMLSVADKIPHEANNPDGSPLKQSREVDPVALLRDPSGLTGEWIHIDLATVQITRIAVPELHRQQQLGSDHYYQIDAVGDLGGVVIKIEMPDKNEPPAIFQNRYPVSVVAKELPAFLSGQIRATTGIDSAVSPVRMKCRVDGFFYRLWGYDSDFMNRRGGGQQFGPLVIASRITNLEPTSSDPVGVRAIGSIAAVVILTAMIVIWWWQRRAWAQDDAAKRRRQQHLSDHVQIPD